MAENNFIQQPETTLNKNIRKELDDVANTIRTTMIDFHNYVYPKYIKNYKDYLCDVSERLSSIDGWQTNVGYPMISSTVDTMFSNIFDFGYEFGIKELGLKNLCTKAFDFRGSGKKVFKDLGKEVLILGKGYVKDYLIKEDEENVFFGRTIKQTIKTPSMMFISAFDVMFERSKGLENSPYKIIRTFSTGESIKQKIIPLLSQQTGKTKEEVEKTIDFWFKGYKKSIGTRFSFFNYNPIKATLATKQWMDAIGKEKKGFFDIPYLSNYDAMTGYINTQSGMLEDGKNFFIQKDEATFELVEYTTSTKRYIYINGNIVYFGNKIKNIGEVREAVFSSIPGTGNAIGVADKLSPLQAINNTLWNAFIDNIKLNLGPMFRITGNIPQGKNGTLDFKAFRTIKTQGQNDIEKIQLGVNDFGGANAIQMVETAGQKDFAITNYVMGGTGAIERTQGGLDLKFNQYKSRLTPMTDSIDQLMANIARSRVLMYLKFFTKQELLKLGVDVQDIYEKDENGKEKFKTIELNGIDITTIIDETNITFSYNSLDKVTKEAARDTISRNLQYLLQYSGNKLNMDEVAKIMSGLDFNPQLLFKKEEPVQQPPQEQVIEEQPQQPEAEEQQSDAELLKQLQNIM